VITIAGMRSKLRRMNGLRRIRGSNPARDCMRRALQSTSFPSSRAGLLLEMELAFMPR
jgi:hypothetical protein